MANHRAHATVNGEGTKLLTKRLTMARIANTSNPTAAVALRKRTVFDLPVHASSAPSVAGIDCDPRTTILGIR
jgi:hypothetical protein